MRIPERILAEIQSRLDIAEVIGEYVQLQKKGNRYWGLCPFHQEKTPSFSVTPEKGIYYCFGCHKGGGVFQFLMDADKVSFLDAVEMLAKKAGVEIPRVEGERDGLKRETWFEFNRRVATSFHWLLTEGAQAETARSYLARRGVTPEIIEQFQLGYAPADRSWLHRFLVSKSYSEEFLAGTGLFANTAGGPKSALFANRVIFPIQNARGEIVAFGGRALGDGVPKYLNSPETAVFRKGENLYGLDKAARSIHEAGLFFLVEGYMDVIAMHQAGVANCVAPLGTALTEAQARLLKRHAHTAVIAFDGDEAGRKASLRAIDLLERQDLVVRVVELPDDRDPAEYVQEGAVEALKTFLAAQKDSFTFLLESAAKGRDVTKPEGKEAIRDFIFPYIAGLPSRLRADEYLKALSEALDADAAAVREDFAAWRSRAGSGGSRSFAQSRSAEAGQQAQRSGPLPGGSSGGLFADRSRGEGAISSDLFLMLAVAANQDLFRIVRTSGITLANLDDDRARALFVALEEAFRDGESGFDSLCARIDDPALRELALRKAASGEFDLNQEKIVTDGVRGIRERELKRKSEKLGAELRRVERDKPDPARLRELLAEKIHLDNELVRMGARTTPAREAGA